MLQFNFNLYNIYTYVHMYVHRLKAWHRFSFLLVPYLEFSTRDKRQTKRRDNFPSFLSSLGGLLNMPLPLGFFVPNHPPSPVYYITLRHISSFSLYCIYCLQRITLYAISNERNNSNKWTDIMSAITTWLPRNQKKKNSSYTLSILDSENIFTFFLYYIYLRLAYNASN